MKRAERRKSKKATDNHRYRQIAFKKQKKTFSILILCEFQVVIPQPTLQLLSIPFEECLQIGIRFSHYFLLSPLKRFLKLLSLLFQYLAMYLST